MLLFPFMVFESQIREFGLTKEEREIYVRLLDEFENVAEYLKVRFGYTLRINLRFTKLQVPYVLYSALRKKLADSRNFGPEFWE